MSVSKNRIAQPSKVKGWAIEKLKLTSVGWSLSDKKLAVMLALVPEGTSDKAAKTALDAAYIADGGAYRKLQPKKAKRKSFGGVREPVIAKQWREPEIAKVVGDEFLSSYEWRKLRMVALTKYGAKCQCCGATPATGAVMNVDHIKPRRLFPHLALTLDNLQVLCHECNHGKGNWDTTDWRSADETPTEEQRAHLHAILHGKV